MKLRIVEILLNLLFWLASGWLVVNSLSVTGQEVIVENGVETVTLMRDDHLFNGLLLIVSLCILSFYLHLCNILTHPKRKKGYLTTVFGIAILFIPYGLIRIIGSTELLTEILIPGTFEFAIYIFYFSCATGYGVVKLFLKSEESKKKLQLEKKQAELSLLRNQLQPHFLFNALNNVLSMVDQTRDPQLANVLDQLSELLRYVVYDTQGQNVPIRKEIDFIKAYAQLHKLRFDDSELNFNLEVIGENLDQPIEPGLFIPFIENAFKYGALPEEKSDISVTIDLSQPQTLFFQSINPIYPELQNQESSGTGVANVRERLKLAYPGKYQLKISDQDHYIVELQIDHA